MGWIEPVSTAVTAAALASQLAKSSTTIRKYASRLHYWLKHGSVIVPIFGAGGVGKTTLGRLLAGDEPLEISAPYDESWQIDHVKLPGDVPGMLLVAPGQPMRVERHWSELFGNAHEKTCLGVVNVAAFGYHSFAIPLKEHDGYEAGMSAGEFLLKYIAARRDLELELLRRLVNGLAAIKRPFWMVTVVNKQDLWWADKVAVKQHYLADYEDTLASLRDSIGGRNFQHEFLPVSLTIGNFTASNGDILAPNVSGYDQAVHLRHLQSLFDKLHDLIARGTV